LKAIQKELGEMDDAVSETEELEQKIAKAGMSKEAKEKQAHMCSHGIGQPSWLLYS
jgi:ATP-dependent Lon protease